MAGQAFVRPPPGFYSPHGYDPEIMNMIMGMRL
jgi:hypothetical protein